jgi:hypothetical protein
VHRACIGFAIVVVIQAGKGAIVIARHPQEKPFLKILLNSVAVRPHAWRTRSGGVNPRGAVSTYLKNFAQCLCDVA